MFCRIGVLGTLLIAAVWGQFAGLSSTADGSAVYFSSTLRLKGGAPLLNGKIFAAAADGVRLVRERERAGVPANSPPCTVAGFADYLGTETSSSGTLAISYRANSGGGGCSFPVNSFRTEILARAGVVSVAGVGRLSPDGRYAILLNAQTGRPFSAVSIALLDLQTGVQTAVPIDTPAFPSFLRIPFGGGGRVIANDGTALLGVTDGSVQNSGYVLKPGLEPQRFPAAGLPLLIDASGKKVLYQDRGIRLLDLATLASMLLIPSDRPAFGYSMSDDARRVVYVGDGQVHVVETATLADRAVTDDPAKVTEATISGDGRVIYAVTGRGRLLRINADDGVNTEVIGRTPYLQPAPSGFTPGLAPVLNGSGLTDRAMSGAPPFAPFLGDVTMWVGERKIPLIEIAPDHVRFLLPWDIQPVNGSLRMLVESAGENTPFYFPEVEVTNFTANSRPQAGRISHENWQPTFVGPVNTGEIIHVLALGLGAVSPEVADGRAAPSSEPLARITNPLTCTNAEVLYAGLAPGAVERVYQVDLRIGPVSGYQKFTCTLGGGEPFIFLTLDVVSP